MKKKVFMFVFIIILSSLWATPANAGLAPGHLDTGFNPGSGANNEKVDVLTIASDGKIILAGDFTQFDGISRNRIARLHGDGSLDISFNPSSGPNNIILALAVQPDGKVLVGGDFTSMNGVTQSGIARLNTNGTLDTSFHPGSTTYNNVTALALQPDGKVIIACKSMKIDDTWFWKITRLNPDGSVDSTFTPTNSINGKIKSIALEAYGTLLIGGAFTQVAGQTRIRIARINANGSLDAGFNPGTGANDVIEAVTVRHDGKIMIAGWFTQFNGLSRYKVARLNSSGSLDLSFNGTVDIINNVVYTLAVQYDGHEGHVVIGGSFTNVLGSSRNGIARLTDDGNIDLSFSPGSGANDTIFTLALEPDNKVVIGGYFSTYNGYANVNHITRVNRDGSRDIAFSQGASGGVISGDVYSIAQQQSGKTIIGGAFSEYGGEYRKNVARLLANGKLDDSFFPPTDINGIVRTVAINEANNSVFIAGQFTLVGGETRNKIARLSSTGSLDLRFDPGDGPNGDIYAMLIQPDGKILIGGDFSTVHNTSRNRIARLNSDGTLDKSFNPGAGASGIVLALALQDNGKILIGGAFSSYSDTPRKAIALLNADGSLETRFNTENGLEGFSVTNIAIRPDNKIMIGGEFTSYDGYIRNRVALLNSNGTLDTSFDPGIGPNSVVEALALQSDGKVVIGGSFTTLNNYSQNRLARLQADGSPDPSFNIGAGANSVVYDIALQPDGKVLIGGSFTTVWGVDNQNRVARLNGATPPVLLTTSLPSAVVGEYFTYTLNASSYPYRPRFDITSGDLPTGMNLNPVTGLLYGTPVAGSVGVYPLTLTVSNSVSPNAVHNITLTVVQASTPPSITSLNNTTFMVGSSDTFTVTTSGYPTPTLSKTGGLPDGVTFTDDGHGTATLAGTPAAGTSGEYVIDITASNGVSPDATQTFTLTVVSAPTAPAITSGNNTTFMVGSPGTFTVTTSGYPTPTLSKTGGLPDGVTFTDNSHGTATLAGTPAAGTAGNYIIEITASNGVSPDATQTFTLTVVSAPTAPTITSADTATFTIGQDNSFTIETSGYPTPKISKTGGLPNGVTFTDDGHGTATLAGTPAAGTTGEYVIDITASNGVEPNATQVFTLTIRQPGEGFSIFLPLILR